jgi:hypothetical protein
MGWVPTGFDADGWQPDGWQPGVEAAEALEFVGPDISTINLTEDAAMSPRDFSARFSSPNPITYALNGTPPAGVTLDANGVLSGTPTETGTFAGLSITADDGSTTEDSNAFSIQVFAAGAVSSGVGDGELGASSVGDDDLGGSGMGA